MKLADIPLDQIDTGILSRDRSVTDPQAMEDLVRSITDIGLRHPIEVFGIEPDEHHPLPYALISGFRRLTACRTLGHETIPALLCNPGSIPAALAAMVAENEVRVQVSPWEKGHLILTLVEHERFPDAETAIAALYPSATRQHRGRLRGFYTVVEALYPPPRTPERLTVAQMDRLATAVRLGGADAITGTLAANGTTGHTLALQWEALRPVLNAILCDYPEPGPTGPRHPRHALTLRQGMTLTREHTSNGWIIRMTGPMARSPGLVDDVFDLVEKWLQPGA